MSKALLKKVCQPCKKGSQRGQELSLHGSTESPSKASLLLDGEHSARTIYKSCSLAASPLGDLIANTAPLWFFTVGSLATWPPRPKMEGASEDGLYKLWGKVRYVRSSQVHVPFLCVGGHDCREGVAPPRKTRASRGYVRCDVFATAAKKMLSDLYLHCQGIPRGKHGLLSFQSSCRKAVVFVCTLAACASP